MADEPDAQAEEEAPKKKSKKFLFIILGVVILALGGGGFFAYTKFFAPKPVIEGEEKIEEQVNPLEAIGEMFQLEQFVVNLAHPQGKRYLKLKVEIELESAEAVEVAAKASPKLQDVVIMMLTSMTFEEVMTPEGKIQIKDELLERFNQVMRPERIRNIYFTEFVVQ